MPERGMMGVVLDFWGVMGYERRGCRGKITDFRKGILRLEPTLAINVHTRMIEQ